MITTDRSPKRDPIQSRDLTLSSASGNALAATLSENHNAPNSVGVILCPGFAVGKEGEFVKTMERAVLSNQHARWGLRFNFSGHTQGDFNSDLRGFSFTKAVKDFQAAVRTLREAGAEKVVALCSSTGTQPALLAGCEGQDSADAIIGRSSIVDCFKSIMSGIPAQIREAWESAGAFDFPVGGKPVRLSSELLLDIKGWNMQETLPKLKVPVHLVHGGQDTVSRLSVLEQTIAFAPQGRITLEVFDGEKHEMSNLEDAPTFQWMMERLRSSTRG